MPATRYMSQLPSPPQEVRPFLEQALRAVGQQETTAVEVERIKELLLATHEKEPQDSKLKAFAAEQGVCASQGFL